LQITVTTFIKLPTIEVHKHVENEALLYMKTWLYKEHLMAGYYSQNMQDRTSVICGIIAIHIRRVILKSGIFQIGNCMPFLYNCQ